MRKIDKILCPVDLWRNENREYLRHAVSWAQVFQSEIVLLYVSSRFIHFHDTPPNITETMDSLSAEVIHQSSAKIRRLAKESIFRDVKVCTRLYYGETREKILEAIQREKIDLVVMGTRGKREAVSRMVFGSVAENTVRLSPVPVLTVKPEDA